MLAMARAERGVEPVTKRRNLYLSFGSFAGSPVMLRYSLSDRPQVQPDDDLFGIGKVADHPLQRWRKPADKCRYRHDLVACSKLPRHHEIDHLDRVPPRQVLLADPLEICDCREGFRGLAG